MVEEVIGAVTARPVLRRTVIGSPHEPLVVGVGGRVDIDAEGIDSYRGVRASRQVDALFDEDHHLAVYRVFDAAGIATQQFLGALVVLYSGFLGEECGEPLLYGGAGAGEQGVQCLLIAGAQFDGLAPVLPRHDLAVAHADLGGEVAAVLAQGVAQQANFASGPPDRPRVTPAMFFSYNVSAGIDRYVSRSVLSSGCSMAMGVSSMQDRARTPMEVLVAKAACMPLA
jgi:hypothetical protein